MGWTVHAAKLLNQVTCGISALCFEEPHDIDMQPGSGQTWTLDVAEVTCPDCLKLLADPHEVEALARRLAAAAKHGFDGSLADVGAEREKPS